MSGSQIQPLDCRAVRFSANADTRLRPKKSVPTNSTITLSQPIWCGRHRHQLQDGELNDPLSSRSVGVFEACTTEA